MKGTRVINHLLEIPVTPCDCPLAKGATCDIPELRVAFSIINCKEGVERPLGKYRVIIPRIRLPRSEQARTVRKATAWLHDEHESPIDCKCSQAGIFPHKTFRRTLA